MMNDKKKTIQIGWLSTGNGEGSIGLLRKILELTNKNKNVNISYVFCNRELGEKSGSDNFINFVKKNKIKIINFSSNKFKKNTKKKWKDLRYLFDEVVIEKISKHKVDFIVSAGYMLFAPLLCTNYTIINLHPALPNGPNGTWKQVIRKLIINNEDESGISIHLMTPDLDEGPNISYCKFKIKSEELKTEWKAVQKNKNIEIENSKLFFEIRKKIVNYEQILLYETISKIGMKEIDINNSLSLDLSAEVNKKVKQLS